MGWLLLVFFCSESSPWLAGVLNAVHCVLQVSAFYDRGQPSMTGASPLLLPAQLTAELM